MPSRWPRKATASAIMPTGMFQAGSAPTWPSMIAIGSTAVRVAAIIAVVRSSALGSSRKAAATASRPATAAGIIRVRSLGPSSR